MGPSGQGSGAAFWGGFRLSRPTGSSLEQAGLWKRGIKAKLVSLCLGFSEHWDIQSLSCQNLLPEPLTSCSAVVQGREAGWDAWGGQEPWRIQREC